MELLKTETAIWPLIGYREDSDKGSSIVMEQFSVFLFKNAGYEKCPAFYIKRDVLFPPKSRIFCFILNVKFNYFRKQLLIYRCIPRDSKQTFGSAVASFGDVISEMC
jgi:hypothetical protein